MCYCRGVGSALRERQPCFVATQKAQSDTVKLAKVVWVGRNVNKITSYGGSLVSLFFMDFRLLFLFQSETWT